MTLENQLRGFKATLSNANVSEDAKQHARQEIARIEKELGVQSTLSDHEAEVHSHRVAGGYKATIANPNTSEEAKQHAREALKNAELDHHTTTHTGTEHEEHNKHVLGGYKATLHNRNVSEDAKEHAREVLADNGEAPV